ncbi:MAG: protein kinase [Deltaproteobacteria bacterium]|nr:protein kinase [Deltaproteobacteria bacterium]
MSRDPMIGMRLSDRFEITRLIGQGGMGTVYEAHHTVLPRRFAIKVLRTELASDADFIERLRREAIAAARVEHPNVVQIIDFGRSQDDMVYMVMEYLEGTPLDEVLTHTPRLPLNRVIPLLLQIADALDVAHREEVVHRDLKPENILLTTVRGQNDVVKVLDFGIAKVRAADAANELTVEGQVFGTAEYMSPEQATGESVDGRSDIYALGCLANEMITGDPPFLGTPMEVMRAHVHKDPPTPSTLVRDHQFPPAVDALLLRCLAKKPEDRYQSAAELRRDLIKLRGILYSRWTQSSKKDSARRFSLVPQGALEDGWQPLGGTIPSLIGSIDNPTGEIQSIEPKPDRQVLRERYQQALRELAFELVKANIALSGELSQTIDRLLVIEEEVAALTGTIALSEQSFDRIRFEFSQREKRFGHAILDLTLSRAQVEGRHRVDPSSGTELQLRDLDFQITELKKRCDEIKGDCASQIRALDGEVKEHRRRRQKREDEAQELYQSLHATVEALRPRAADQGFSDLFRPLDDVLYALKV